MQKNIIITLLQDFQFNLFGHSWVCRWFCFLGSRFWNINNIFLFGAVSFSKIIPHIFVLVLKCNFQWCEHFQYIGLKVCTPLNIDFNMFLCPFYTVRLTGNSCLQHFQHSTFMHYVCCWSYSFLQTIVWSVLLHKCQPAPLTVCM